MKKKLKGSLTKKVIAIALILAVQYPMLSLAASQLKEQSFLISDNKEAEAGATVQLTLNLDKISYDNFEFSLASSAENENLNSVQVDNEHVVTTKNGNNLIITGQKSNLSTNKIALTYTVPSGSEEGSTITLTGVITNSEDSTEKEETIITIKVTEKKNNNQKDSENNNQGKPGETVGQPSGNMQEKQGNMNENDKQNGSSMSEKTKTSGSSIPSSSMGTAMGGEEENTYNGESDNYLTTLNIEGYSFTTDFSKTKTTYFASVASDVTSLQINAEAEDENAIVAIYGNESLKSGQNKILISVTAENGEVKTYRIYVDKN